jgi:hypothetical protein
MIGDSLAQGTEPFLPGQLGGWTVRQDAARGRTLGQGMAILGSTDTGGRPVALAFSLFTNDDPRNVGALESAVRRSVARAGANGCAIWATIARPAVGGVSYGAANARLRRLDAQLGRRLAVVPWAERARGSGWLVRDGVHATPAGYRARAALYAQAARSC